MKSERTCEADSSLHIWQRFNVKLQNDFVCVCVCVLHRTLSSAATSLQLKAAALLFDAQAQNKKTQREKNELQNTARDFFQTINNGSLKQLLVGIVR